MECLSVIFPAFKGVGKVEFKLLLLRYGLLRVNQEGGEFTLPDFSILRPLSLSALLKKRVGVVCLSSLLRRFLVEKNLAVLTPFGMLVPFRVIQDARKSICLQCLTWKLFVKAVDNVIKLIGYI